MLPSSKPPETYAGRSVGEIDDVMIKDPVCDVYFPQRNGVHLNADGQDLYFCSRECRDKFVGRRSK
jgi:YHS domain-containing protein